MRDIQFVKNQFVSRIPKSLQTCFRASLEKAFSNPLGTEVVLEQTNHRKCCECDIHILEFWSGNKDPPKVLWQYWWPWIFRILRNKKDLNKKLDLFPSCRQKYKLSFFLLASFISLMRSENFISMNADRDWLETSRREIRGISGSTTSSRLLPFWRRITCKKKEICIFRRKKPRWPLPMRRTPWQRGRRHRRRKRWWRKCRVRCWNPWLLMFF